MDNIEPRLVRCFAAVFPGVPDSQIRRASVRTLECWDSVAMATLIAAVGEEFGVDFEVDGLTNLISFESILGYLRQVEASQ